MTEQTLPAGWTQEQMDELEERNKRAEVLLKQDPRLGHVSAYIMAGDQMSADRSFDKLQSGEWSWGRAKALVGSYGRLDFMVRAHAAGLIRAERLLEDLTDDWSGSDPDDTDPRFLAVWLTAFVQNDRHYLRQEGGRPLPRASVQTVYRGQDLGAPFGIAWSLDPKTAAKFARGAATRQANRHGVVYAAEVDRKAIMGYMTRRNESEVIINPTELRKVRIVQEK